MAELEERAADLLEVPHVVALSSCTAGLMLVLQAVDARGPVVMPSFTFAASAHAVHWAGGTPVWAEVRREDLTLDPADAAEQIEPVRRRGHDRHPHLRHALPGRGAAGGRRPRPASRCVYDAAHALGSRRRGRPVGGFGVAEVFSMSPTKVTTAGEGGLVATRDDDLAARLRIGRNYGNPGDYDCTFPGLNARMSEMHAAIALAGLDTVQERVAYRNELVDAFRTNVKDVPGLAFPRLDEDDLSTYKDLTLDARRRRLRPDHRRARGGARRRRHRLASLLRPADPPADRVCGTSAGSASFRSPTRWRTGC